MAGTTAHYNQVSLVSPIIADTTVGWTANDVVIPANTMARDTTLGRVKIGNGTSKFSELAWNIEASLPTEYRVLLDKLFTTADGGLTYSLRTGLVADAPIIAGADGKIDHTKLPDFILNTVKVVGTYGDLLALDAAFHSTIVLVVDATNGTATGGGTATAGDTTVASGAAMYIWYDPDGEGALPQSWNKVSEIGELDINWDAQLTGYFKYSGDGSNTLDDISDGAIYGKVTNTEIARLAGVETAADVTDYQNVQAADAVMYDHPLITKQMNAADLAAFLALGPNV